MTYRVTLYMAAKGGNMDNRIPDKKKQTTMTTELVVQMVV